MKTWQKVKDKNIRHIWVSEEGCSVEDCGGPVEITVSPNWYADNGTPCCPCGEDMVYSHTEICESTLVDFMARMLHYAQEHIRDSDSRPRDLAWREHALQCVSYQTACFLAQNTVHGRAGVDWSIVIDELIETDPSPVKSVKKWKKILNRIAKDLGGWKGLSE